MNTYHMVAFIVTHTLLFPFFLIIIVKSHIFLKGKGDFLHPLLKGKRVIAPY